MDDNGKLEDFNHEWNESQLVKDRKLPQQNQGDQSEVGEGELNIESVDDEVEVEIVHEPV